MAIEKPDAKHNSVVTIKHYAFTEDNEFQAVLLCDPWLDNDSESYIAEFVAKSPTGFWMSEADYCNGEWTVRDGGYGNAVDIDRPENWPLD